MRKKYLILAAVVASLLFLGRWIWPIGYRSAQRYPTFTVDRHANSEPLTTSSPLLDDRQLEGIYHSAIKVAALPPSLRSKS